MALPPLTANDISWLRAINIVEADETISHEEAKRAVAKSVYGSLDGLDASATPEKVFRIACKLRNVSEGLIEEIIRLARDPKAEPLRFVPGTLLPIPGAQVPNVLRFDLANCKDAGGEGACHTQQGDKLEICLKDSEKRFLTIQVPTKGIRQAQLADNFTLDDIVVWTSPDRGPRQYVKLTPLLAADLADAVNRVTHEKLDLGATKDEGKSIDPGDNVVLNFVLTGLMLQALNKFAVNRAKDIEGRPPVPDDSDIISHEIADKNIRPGEHRVAKPPEDLPADGAIHEPGGFADSYEVIKTLLKSDSDK